MWRKVLRGVSMKLQIKSRDWLFLFSCLGLAIIGELSFFHEVIGISYVIFISMFFGVFFARHRKKLSNGRMGILVVICIFLITGSYAIHDKVLFSFLNLLVVLLLSFISVVLFTSPKGVKWEKPRFVIRLLEKLGLGIQYSLQFINQVFKTLFKNVNPEKAKVIKQILIALLIAVPLLSIIITLLMSADEIFEDIVLLLPTYMINLNFMEWGFRSLIVIMLSFLFFGVFQTLRKEKQPNENAVVTETKKIEWGSAFGLTILILLNMVYVLFTVIQFKYFFSGSLQSGLTYAEYARRGFFELLAVTIINWTILITFLKLIKTENKPMKIVLKTMYSLLIILSGVMLVSAFQRLSMYEIAYGFTFDRVLAHSFMVFLIVIFAYTFIRVWLEGLKIIHFYLIVGLLYYTGLNVIHMEKFIAEKNWERYEVTGKIDTYHLSTLKSAGLDVLLRLKAEQPDNKELHEAIIMMDEWDNYTDDMPWQSFNLAKNKTITNFQKEISND